MFFIFIKILRQPIYIVFYFSKNCNTYNKNIIKIRKISYFLNFIKSLILKWLMIIKKLTIGFLKNIIFLLENI